MSIAPIPGMPNFGVTPGFGINPAYGVSATPPRTPVDLGEAASNGATFGQILAQQIAAASGAAAPANNPGAAQSAFGVAPVGAATPGVATQNGVFAEQGGRSAAGFDSSFGSAIAGKLGDLAAMNARSDQLAVKAVTGDLKDIHEYTIAANEAALATQLAVSVRDKAVGAFNDIIRMQL
ncbi:flagellar hook-basal body complex protein FliE [Gephyromycinifex aptenodytis]|uniref:flagellar hook-basal body complex protein FliE n=1 Tax=Gephyromycinifex aptenodytis TaxID=2716227 RepID=UPI001D00BE3F|nr:flagellar hook-basal body complex protein FliE [Gephyromycinifex aptenodytis]